MPDIVVYSICITILAFFDYSIFMFQPVLLLVISTVPIWVVCSVCQFPDGRSVAGTSAEGVLALRCVALNAPGVTTSNEG